MEIFHFYLFNFDTYLILCLLEIIKLNNTVAHYLFLKFNWKKKPTTCNYMYNNVIQDYQLIINVRQQLMKTINVSILEF